MLWSKSEQYEYTDGARRAFAHARDEAIRLGHDYVGTEHLLLGLLRDPDSPAVAALARLGVTVDEIEDLVHAAVRPGRAQPAGELPYTSRSRSVLVYAMEEARVTAAEAGAPVRRRKKAVRFGEEHLLAGLVREEKGIAAQILRTQGVTLEALRNGTAAAGEAAGFQIRIDESSDRSIYEQIVQRVQEAAATGELTAGARLPTVRRLADELDIAPGTVARAYGELEQLGVVVTGGARGTRVAARPPRAHEWGGDPEMLSGLLRPVVVAAYHMGADADALRAALENAMRDIFDAPRT